jgi:hypothetical protein
MQKRLADVNAPEASLPLSCQLRAVSECLESVLAMGPEGWELDATSVDDVQ